MLSTLRTAHNSSVQRVHIQTQRKWRTCCAASKGFGNEKRSASIDTNKAGADDAASANESNVYSSSGKTSGPEVYAPAVERAKRASAEEQGDRERAFLLFMGVYFALLLLLGILLAASGLFPSWADALIEKYLYPSYSYIIGIFVAFSGVYGFIKSLS